MMKIEYVAVWTADLVSLRDIYVHYFNAVAGEKYVNPKTCFESYFLSFEEGARLELMTNPRRYAEFDCNGLRAYCDFGRFKRQRRHAD